MIECARFARLTIRSGCLQAVRIDDCDDPAVIFAPVSGMMRALPDIWAALSTAEREAIGRLSRSCDRERRLAAYALRRLALSRYFAQDPASFAFGIGLNGRPVLHAEGDVNLSHSGGWVAVAMTRAGRAGVDVEEKARTTDWRALAPYFLDAGERLEAEGRLDGGDGYYLERWCLKEAILKATGEGLAGAPEKMALTREGHRWTASRAGMTIAANAFTLDCRAAGAWAFSSDAAPRVWVFEDGR